MASAKEILGEIFQDHHIPPITGFRAPEKASLGPILGRCQTDIVHTCFMDPVKHSIPAFFTSEGLLSHASLSTSFRVGK